MIWLAAAFIILLAIPSLIEIRRRPVTKRSRANAPGAFADLPQGDTHYRWIGPMEGPVVVCVHGLTTPSQVWSGIAQGLARMGFRVLIYDLYGRGYSDNPKERQDQGHFLRQLDGVLEHCGVRGPVMMIGYSMGAAIASAFAAQNPTRVARLVLIAPVGMQVKVGRPWIWMANTPVLGDAAARLIGGHLLRRDLRDTSSAVAGLPEVQRHETRRRGAIPAILSSIRYFLRDTQEPAHRKIAEQGPRTLALWGADDVVIPVSALGKLAEWNRNAVQEVVERAGHGLPYTHPMQVLRQISDWIDLS